MSFSYPYPRPAVTVDAAIFYKSAGLIELLLIRRKHPPFQGFCALPGGFVDLDESLNAAVRREVKEETGLNDLDFAQFHTYGDPGRDPRHRTITVVYTSFVSFKPQTVADDDAAQTAWFPLDQLPQLAFDHNRILDDIIKHYNF